MKIFTLTLQLIIVILLGCSNNASKSTSSEPITGSKQFVEVDDPYLVFVGRFLDAEYNGVKEKRSTWPGTYLRFRGKLSDLTIKIRELGDANNRYKFIVDDSIYTEFTPTSNQTDYELLQDFDASQSHEFILYKTTENTEDFGAIQGLYIDNRATLEPPTKKPFQIEFIGDSFTVGYGNLSNQRDNCNPWSTTDNYLSYPRLIANHINADHMINAWSGRGLIQNYNETSPNPKQAIPEVYKYTLQNSTEHLWDFSWHPDLVVIFLGLNDFSTEGDPSSEIYIKGFIDFLHFLQSKYPPATKYLALGSNDFNINTLVQEIVLQEQQGGNTSIFYNEIEYSNFNGCHWHPDTQSHQYTYERLRDKIQEIIQP